MGEYIQQKPRVDSRGLPEGYDPHYFYEYSSMKRSKEANGLEGLIYKWMPLSLVRSFAFAIDPFSKFKVSPGIITPVNRTRELFSGTLLDARYSKYHSYSQTFNFQSKDYGLTIYNPPLITDPPDSKLTSTVGRYGRIKDTSRRTRLINSNDGELELFKFQAFSSERVTNYYFLSTDIYVNPSNGSQGHAGTISRKQRTIYPSAAYITKSRLNQLRDTEIALANSMLAKMAIPMYKGVNPQHRNYSLVRNLIELRDIPRSVSQLRQTVRDLAKFEPFLPYNLRSIVYNTKAVVKDIPNEWLSFHFGWRQLQNDLSGLLSSPAKIARQINFLMKRSGKATTYRSKRTDVSADSVASGFTYDVTIDDANAKTSSRIIREHEYRMVINSTFTFPPVDLPRFRENMFSQKLGAYARATDIYNLVPWTWLVDWFTGLGNYIEIIDEVNRDESLINWGFISLVTKGSIVTEFTSTTTCFQGGRVYPPSPQPQYTYGGNVSVNNPHTSNGDFTIHLRKSLANVMDVNLTSDVGTLNPYQKSILGALVSQRSKFWRGH